MVIPALGVDASSTSDSPSVTHRACPVCDADRPQLLFDNPMVPIAGIPFGYPVVACGACGSVYAGAAPDVATLCHYYHALSKYDHPRIEAELPVFDRHRAELAAAFTRRLVAFDAHVLDVGCSIGLYLAALARLGSIRVRGVDPSPTAAEAARTLFGLDVAVGDASDDLDYAREDAIALLAVLEHLRDPRPMVECIARSMKSGALLIVEIPDADAFGDYRGVEPFGEFSNEHINFFGEAALRRLCAAAGLREVATERIAYLNGNAGLFAAFRKGEAFETMPRISRTADSIARYVARSSAALADVEARLRSARIGERPSVLYGAGSHSARLLARGVLRDAPVEVALDRNRNLVGRMLGNLRVEAPTAIDRYPGRPVVVSTFNAMRPIADFLSARGVREIVTLYAQDA